MSLMRITRYQFIKAYSERGIYVSIFYKGVKGDEQKIITRKIYIPLLWSDVLERGKTGDSEYKYVAKILPLFVYR